MIASLRELEKPNLTLPQNMTSHFSLQFTYIPPRFSMLLVVLVDVMPFKKGHLGTCTINVLTVHARGAHHN